MSSLLITQGLGSPTLTVIAVTPSSGSVEIQFSSAVALIADAGVDANWSITSVGNPDLVISNISTVGDTVTISTSEQINGETYEIAIPYYIVSTVNGTTMAAGYTQSFTGVGSSPIIVSARGVDSRTIDVVFSEPVNESDALIAGNYSIIAGGSVSIVSVVKVSNVVYRLTTTEQEPSTAYTIEVSNVRDLAGNVI